jgi:prefoldin subunit 5
MEKQQWSAMSKNEKLDYLHERIQATDAEMTRISSEISKAVMRLKSRIDGIEKSGKKKPKRVKARKSA